jgi:transcriptional regulator with XRE-family HTH domain
MRAMNRHPAPPGSLRQRVALAVQRGRQRRGLSQRQVAEQAKCSLKYIGEIERGEANFTIDALERITTALNLDLFAPPVPLEGRLPEGIRTLLLSNLQHLQQLVETAIGWLSVLEADLAQRPIPPATPPDETPIRRRGRPRKPKLPPPESGSES